MILAHLAPGDVVQVRLVLPGHGLELVETGKVAAKHPMSRAPVVLAVGGTILGFTLDNLCATAGFAGSRVMLETDDMARVKAAKVQSTPPWEEAVVMPRTYFPPFMPHELDAHPDGKRIEATIEDRTGKFEDELEKRVEEERRDLEEDVSRVEAERDEAQKEAEELAREKAEAEQERDEAQGLILELASALLEENRGALVASLENIAGYLVDTNKIGRAEAVQLEGLAEVLAELVPA